MEFSPHLAQTSPHPMGLKITRAEGIYLWDEDGKRYTDLISGIAVNNIGHSHPAVVHAIEDQLTKYQHIIPFGEFVQSPQNDLADALCELLPDSLNAVYFVNSGTESIEAALKLAKRYTGRHEVVAMEKSYHGATHGSLSVTGNEVKKQRFRPGIPGTTFLPFNDLAALAEIDERHAAVVIEPVQGDAGVRIPSSKYLKALQERCNEVGALLIADEIQTGMGRTGSWFAFQRFGFTPDILCVAKAFGGGMPIGAFVSDKKIMETLQRDPMLGHITTFGGHPVCCAAALANIKVLSASNWIREAEAKGQLLAKALEHPKVKEVRQIGLMLAVDLESEEQVNQLIQSLLEEGIIAFYFLSCRNAFRLAPPLCITEAQLNESIAIIRKALDRL